MRTYAGCYQAKVAAPEAIAECREAPWKDVYSLLLILVIGRQLIPIT